MDTIFKEPVAEQPAQAEFNESKAEAFAGRMVAALSESAMTVMMSLGHRAGLFDTMATMPAATSAEIAASSGLIERYVREWLAVMVTSGVIEYEPAEQHYRLPAEHAAFLARAASPDNLAVTTQFIAITASVEEKLLERFRSGGGMHYHHYDRFHEVMAEDSAQLVVSALLDKILPEVPGLADRLHDGIDVVDIGCGGGRALYVMAEAFPESRFTGIDLCGDAFAKTREKAEQNGIRNLRFEAADLSTNGLRRRYDLITAFDAIHDQKDPQGILDMVCDGLREDGVFLMQDIGGSRYLENNIENPFAPLLYTLSCMHCTPISIGQGGPGLGTMWGVETAEEYLSKAGFGSVETKRLPHDPLNAYYIARR